MSFLKKKFFGFKTLSKFLHGFTSTKKDGSVRMRLPALAGSWESTTWADEAVFFPPILDSKLKRYYEFAGRNKT